jgi:hypothetical protein
MKTLLTFLLLIGALSICSAQWVQTSLDTLEIRSLAVRGTNIFAGTACIDGGVFLSSDNGANWTPVNAGLPTNDLVGSLAVSGNNLFAGTYGRWETAVYLSSNDGQSWDPIGEGGIVAVSGTSVLVGTWMCIPDGCAGDIRFSSDSGTTWDTTSLGYTYELPCIAIGDTYLFVGFRAGTNNWGGNGVFSSTDFGATWELVNSGLSDTNIVSLFAVGGTLFAGTEHGAYRSTNKGTSWTPANSGLVDIPVSCFAVNTDGGILFAGTLDNGVFLSTNNGIDWTPVNSGLMDSTVKSLAVTATTVFAAIESSGVWRCPLSELTTTIGNEVILPTHFALEQNYPNPFNPTTTIRYQLLNTRHVTLKVLDILGREVATLVNGVEAAGHRSVQFDGHGLASGVYLYQLRTSDFASTKKFLLLR